MQVDKIETRQNNKICVWMGSYGYTIESSDKEAFIKHMESYRSICGLALSRAAYEAAYARLGLGEPVPDDSLGTYANKYGNFGMSHYHTDPANRAAGLRGELDQCRWHELLKEQPDIEDRRAREKEREMFSRELEENRAKWPSDLDKFIQDLGGYEQLYERCLKAHSNNSVQLRDEGLHMEWLIGHTVKTMAIEASYTHPDYRKASCPLEGDYLPYMEQAKWWADWSNPYLLIPQHPLKRLSDYFKDRRIKPYRGKVEYFGYGEDCEDDVRKNAKEWGLQ